MKLNRLLLGVALVGLTACGQDVATALDRGLYHTQLFEDNMYVDSILNSTLAEDNIATTQEHVVDTSDVYAGVSNLKGNEWASDDDYATNNKLSLELPDIRYGFESKLFDGILHCSDAIRISKSRLQIQESGFGYIFPKTLVSAEHVGLYMKSGADTYSGGVFISDVRIFVSFYIPGVGESFTKHEISFDITGIRRSDFPQLYAFYFDDLAGDVDLEGATAISVTYEILDDDAKNSDPRYTALFVYELLLPNSEWH